MKQRRVLWGSDVELVHGEQQQATDSSASGADRGGKGRARSTQDGGKGRSLRQGESLVAGRGLGTDSSEDIGAGRKKGQVRFEGTGFELTCFEGTFVASNCMLERLHQPLVQGRSFSDSHDHGVDDDDDDNALNENNTLNSNKDALT